jgi:hypothetical protein
LRLAKKAAPVPNMEDSNPRPFRRLRPTSTQQKVTIGAPPPPKDVKNKGRSGNVYENKGSNDKMTDTVSGICAWLSVVLQKNTDFERHFALNFSFTLRYS